MNSVTEIAGILALDGEPREVLVLEDLEPIAELLAECMAAMGHHVTVIAGVAKIEGGQAECLVHPFDAPRRSIDLRRFDAALLDHNFPGGLNGRDVAAALAQIGRARCLAISSDPSANARMVAAGATAGIRKNALVQVVHGSW